MLTKQNQLDEIKQRILSDMECPLKDAATKLVFGKGNPDAKIIFIGEAPGEQEDLQGIPFVGRAGKELDKLLNTIGLSLDDVYIANILKYRPPNNRDPNTDEIIRHTPYLVEQISVIRPLVICTLGNFSTKFVLAKFNVDEMKNIPGILTIHGQHKEVTIEDRGSTVDGRRKTADGIEQTTKEGHQSPVTGNRYTVVPLFHPAAILYRPQWRSMLEEDFKNMKPILDQHKS